jgi:pimeloyl-ACP methyl ester carboxylesterase
MKVQFDDSDIESILQKVAAYPWEQLRTIGGWEAGLPPAYMQELARYWVTQYDWKRAQEKINRFSHHQAHIEDGNLHYILERGSGQRTPIVLVHGWPYSFYTLLDLVEPLAHPDRFGGNAEEGRDVVVISLPGYGFSNPPEKPIGPKAIAHRLNTLMIEVLGFDRYIIQGGDWGALIASWAAIARPNNVAGIHINLFVDHYGTELEAETLEEIELQKKVQQHLDCPPFAYFKYQMAYPQSLGLVMNDNPVGIASWIIEKFYYWSDLRQRSFEEVYSKDRLLDEITIYLMTRSFPTSLWVYYAYDREDSFIPLKGKRVEAPTALTCFPDPLDLVPPRHLAEQSHNIVQYWRFGSNGTETYAKAVKIAR